MTFVSGDGITEYMHLFTADGFEGEPLAPFFSLKLVYDGGNSLVKAVLDGKEIIF